MTEKKTSFKQAIVAAADIARELNIEPAFKSAKRIRHVKRQPAKMAVGEHMQCPEIIFEIEFFNALLDTAIMSLNERFQQLENFAMT